MRDLRYLVAAFILSSTIDVGAAQLLYFDEDGGGANPRGLYYFDTLTGVSTLCAPVGGTERFFAMDARPSDGELFAVATGPNSGLFTIDPATGVYSLVGQTGVSWMLSLAFDPLTGQLYGLQNLGGLYSIDQNTGAASRITPPYGDTVDKGLAFSAAGEAFAFTPSGHLFRVDLTTGGTTPVGGTGNPVDYGYSGVNEDAAFTASGELYAADWNGTIYRSDPITGNGIAIGSTGMGSGLIALTAVPEPSATSLMICGAWTIGFAMRKRALGGG